MAQELLSVQNLTVSVGEKEILHAINLAINPGETHVLMGPNGAGKSTLGYALMGNPKYSVTAGSIFFDGEDITHLSVDKRARKGLFLSFQNPLEVPGIRLGTFLKTALEQQRGKRIKAWDFRKELRQVMALLQMDRTYADRDLNMGFSGGEKKKAEILQLLLLNPKLAILDETDSGLDVDAVKIVSQGIRAFQEHRNGALLIITHNTKILESLHVDRTHVMAAGTLVKEGGNELVAEINKEGFEQFLKE